MSQGQLLGDHVDELTIYLGRGRDDGNREVFAAVTAGHRHHQAKRQCPDYVPTDRLLSELAVAVSDIEEGKRRPHEIGWLLQAAIEAAEAAPF